MKKLLLGLLFSLPLLSQQMTPADSLQEDCRAIFSFTAASSGAQAAVNSTGTSIVIDNRQVGCLDWLVTYQATTAVTVLSLAFQTATNVAGVPGTWSNYPGTIISGINPNTAATSGGAVTETTGVTYPFLRINLTALTGAGTVSGKLYGWKRRPTYVSVTAGGGCPGTIATPCVVVGPTPVGETPTQSPVQMGGWDSLNDFITRIVTDSNGNIINTPLTQGATGSNDIADSIFVPSGNNGIQRVIVQQSLPYSFDGSVWKANFACRNRVRITLTNGTLTSLVAPSGSTSVYVCHAHATTSGSPENFLLREGTGAACGTGTTTIDSYLNTLGFSTDYTPLAPLITTAANGLCIAQSGTQTADVFITYAQF